ncbi:hypothetical protein Godav_014951, partial [Gossypium davidsonii]|nr:hypothetical protein [Gossypium davidsonii]
MGASLTGSFSLKNAYGKIREGTLNSKEPIWELPWKFKGPHQICFFIWLALKQRFLTNTERVRRGVGTISVCGFRGHESKGVLHVLRDCPATRIGQGNTFQLQKYRLRRFKVLLLAHALIKVGCVLVRMVQLGKMKEELWGILDQLKLISDGRVERLLIQKDSLEAATTIQDGSAGISNSTL